MYTKDSKVIEKSGLTPEQLLEACNKYVPDNALAPVIKPAFEAEKEYGISALFIVAHAAVETGWGRSTFAKTRNNYFGFNAIDSNPGKATVYKSAEGSVLSYAAYLKENYLTKGGKYYNGDTISAVFVKYSSSHDIQAELIADIMNTLVKKAGRSPDGFPAKPEPVEEEKITPEPPKTESEAIQEDIKQEEKTIDESPEEKPADTPNKPDVTPAPKKNRPNRR